MMIIIIGFGALHKQYKSYETVSEELDDYNLVKKYLLNDSSLAKSNKPILWVHLTFEKNSRNWLHYGSRSNLCLNQPYFLLTLKSIINKCNDSFNICLIDDRAFNKVIPGWSHDVSSMANPLRCHMRKLAMAKLMYYYGGMSLPASFICTRDVKSLYNLGLNKTEMFCGELKSSGNINDYRDTFPNNLIMGCKKESKQMKKYINFLENLVSRDYTNEMDFTDECNRWIYSQFLDKKIFILDGKYFGVKDQNNNLITIDQLFENKEINLSSKCYGVFINNELILKRTNMQWFARLSAEQAVEVDNIIGNYLSQIN
jgi:hypothetical protein